MQARAEEDGKDLVAHQSENAARHHRETDDPRVARDIRPRLVSGILVHFFVRMVSYGVAWKNPRVDAVYFGNSIEYACQLHILKYYVAVAPEMVSFYKFSCHISCGVFAATALWAWKPLAKCATIIRVDIEIIRERVRQGHYLIRGHAVRHALKEGFELIHMVEAILEGTIIEKYPDDQRTLICGKTTLAKSTILSYVN